MTVCVPWGPDFFHFDDKELQFKGPGSSSCRVHSIGNALNPAIQPLYLKTVLLNEITAMLQPSVRLLCCNVSANQAGC